MTSNIRFDSMGVNKQILLDLFLSFGLSNNKEETINQFISELHNKLGLDITTYISTKPDHSIIKSANKIQINHTDFEFIPTNKKVVIISEEVLTDYEHLRRHIKNGQEGIVYQCQDGNRIFLSCDKERELSSEPVLIQLLDRFDFYINQLADSTTSIERNNSEEIFFKDIIKSLEQNVLVLNNDLKVQHFNKGSKKAFKRSFDIDLKVGDRIFDYSGFDKKYKPMMESALEGRDVKFNFTSLKEDEEGNHEHGVVTFKPIKNQADEIIGVISFTKIVTEFVEINRKLEKRESTLNTILDATPDGIYSVDKNMELLVINEQARQDFKDYVGVDLKAGDNLNDKIPADTLRQWREAYFDKVFANESLVYNASLENENKNQTYFVENRYVPVKDADGNIYAALEVCRDVTELTNKARTLEFKEAELRSLLSNTPTAIAKVGLDGIIGFITNRTSVILGVEQEEIVGKSVFEFIHESEHSKLAKDIKELLQGKSEISNVYRGIHPTIEEFYISGIASISKDIDNKPYEFLLSFYNISDEVKAQQNLLKSRKKYKSIIDGSPAGLAQVNKDGQFVFVSKRGAEILDSDIDTVLNKYFLDYIADHRKETVTENLKSLTEPDQVIEFRLKGKSDKGKAFYIDGTATLLEDDDEGMSTLFIFNDVTSRVLTEKELATYNAEVQEKSAIYKALIDSSFDGIDIIELKQVGDKNNFDGEIVIRNDKMNEYFSDLPLPFISAEDVLKISPEVQANGKPTAEIFKEVIYKNLSNKTHTSDWRIKTNDSLEDFHYSSNVISLKDKTLLIRNLRKVTEMKKQQGIIKQQLNDLSSKNEELEKYIQSNLQLENFAYIASHDLKAPLRTVSSFAFLLKQKAYEKLDEKSKGYLDIVLRSSTNMQMLIDDLLAFSRVGTQKVKYKQIILAPMIKRILLDLNSNIKDSNAEMIINELPEVIYADESMIIQIFLNLLGNGLKFTEKGKSPIVELSSKETNTHWEFTVKDNGIGIKEENVEKIFGIFEKLHSNDIYEGTGLGLSICKKIIEIHEGEISVDSVLGNGSTFKFSIKKNLQE